jgi:hypothetical protein
VLCCKSQYAPERYPVESGNMMILTNLSNILLKAALKNLILRKILLNPRCEIRIILIPKKILLIAELEEISFPKKINSVERCTQPRCRSRRDSWIRCRLESAGDAVVCGAV